MAIGAGKYDDVCSIARLATNGRAVLLIVIGGRRGDGFACQSELGAAIDLPRILRALAEDIERDTKEQTDASERRTIKEN